MSSVTIGGAGSDVARTGGVVWTNPGNADLPPSYASALLPATSRTDYLSVLLAGASPAIPGGSTILSAAIQVVAANVGAIGAAFDSVELVRSAAIVSSQSGGGIAYAPATYSYSVDPVGSALTVAELNAGGLSARVGVTASVLNNASYWGYTGSLTYGLVNGTLHGSFDPYLVTGQPTGGTIATNAVGGDSYYTGGNTFTDGFTQQLMLSGGTLTATWGGPGSPPSRVSYYIVSQGAVSAAAGAGAGSISTSFGSASFTPAGGGGSGTVRTFNGPVTQIDFGGGVFTVGAPAVTVSAAKLANASRPTWDSSLALLTASNNLQMIDGAAGDRAEIQIQSIALVVTYMAPSGVVLQSSSFRRIPPFTETVHQ